MAYTGNTVGTTAWRAKWFSNIIQESLKAALVAEKICLVDRTESRYIYNPYGSTPTTVISGLQGTYAPANYTVTNDTLEVATEFITSEHIAGYEQVLSNFDLFKSRGREMTASAKTAIDKFVINNLCQAGTGAYTTPAGGFTTAANFNKICANLLTKWAGKADTYRGKFMVVEAGDLAGIAEAQGATGFSKADSALNNGYLTEWMTIEIYVVEDSTFGNSTSATAGGGGAYTNSGCRLAGVKGCSTYCAPRGLQYKEKDVSGYTGTEIVIWGLIGFKAWHAKKALTVKITLA